ncbi:MAG: hypothetical protein J0L82_10340 [Deltaproteobacteria bacterium]|nr:hypothetical protein [Deltaproteobacteria bacterium]
MKYSKIQYEDLNPKQQERFDYQKVSAVLADFGFITIALSDDWNGADFLAMHCDGDTLKVQLKGRMTFDKKYFGKDLYICFRDEHQWYLYPHDLLFAKVSSLVSMVESKSWNGEGRYSFPRLSEQHKSLLVEYKIAS